MHQSCLHLASKAGNLDAVEVLLNEGCDSTLLDTEGLSPLQYAVIQNHPDIARLMFERHEDQLSQFCAQKDHSGKNLLHYHAESVLCSIEMVRLLLRYGCDIDQLDVEGNSVLSLYLRSFHLHIQYNVFQLLLQYFLARGCRPVASFPADLMPFGRNSCALARHQIRIWRARHARANTGRHTGGKEYFDSCFLRISMLP